MPLLGQFCSLKCANATKEKDRILWDGRHLPMKHIRKYHLATVLYLLITRLRYYDRNGPQKEIADGMFQREAALEPTEISSLLPNAAELQTDIDFYIANRLGEYPALQLLQS